MGWGQLIGGGLGFLVGGPAGAALGASLGGAAEEVTGGGATGAAREAAATTAAASDRAAQLQREMFERQVELSRPYREAGVAALNKLAPLASEYTPFGTQQFQADPGYAFRLAEGQKALERSAAARGGLMSGATGKALTRYGQEMGSQEYTNAFNRYQAERQARLGPLQSLAGVGQTTAQQLGAAGQQFGTNVGNLYTQQGDIAANALLAGQRARGSAYGQVGSALGRYLSTPAVGGFGAPFGSSGVNPASGEYYGSLEF